MGTGGVPNPLNVTAGAGNTTCDGIVPPGSQGDAFVWIVVSLFVLAGCMLLHNGVRTISVAAERRRQLGAKKRDAILFTLYCMAVSSLFAVFDCGVQVAFFAVCRELSSEGLAEGARMKTDALVLSRYVLYGALIVGLITLTMGWEKIVINTRSLGRRGKNKNARKFAVGLTLYSGCASQMSEISVRCVVLRPGLTPWLCL